MYIESKEKTARDFNFLNMAAQLFKGAIRSVARPLKFAETFL